jgi:hypothetical protein
MNLLMFLRDNVNSQTGSLIGRVILGTLLVMSFGWLSPNGMAQGFRSDSQIAQGQPVDAETHQAMIDAINDEYRARAYYSAVIEQFGPVQPFRNVVQAEDRHVQLWENLFVQYGLPVPEDTFAGNMTVPDRLVDACRGGVDAELADANMYEDFLTTLDDPLLLNVFERLRRVSLDNHLVAFQRCVENDGESLTQSGVGRGQGRGQGQGRGARRNAQQY